LSARFEGGVASRTQNQGVQEVVQNIVVELPAQTSPKRIRADLGFRWADGTFWSAPLEFQVQPRLRATPTGILLPADGAEHEHWLTLESDRAPFRIKSVRGTVVRGHALGSDEPSRTQRVRLKLAATSATRGGPVDIEVVTDHPTTSSVTVTALIVSGAREVTQ
jgi:hypothetical protein